jgi:hypothetical protein
VLIFISNQRPGYTIQTNSILSPNKRIFLVPRLDKVELTNPTLSPSKQVGYGSKLTSIDTYHISQDNRWAGFQRIQTELTHDMYTCMIRAHETLTHTHILPMACSFSSFYFFSSRSRSHISNQ